MESVIKELDSVGLEVEKDSTFLFHNESYFYISNKCKIYEVDESGIINSFSLPETCRCIRRKGSDVYFSSRNRIFKLLPDGTFCERKFRQRILDLLPTDSDYPLVALVCKDLKLLQLHLNESVVTLEKYENRCDASVLYIGFVEDVVVVLYKSESNVNYCLLRIHGLEIEFLRKERLCDYVDLKVVDSIISGSLLLRFKNSFQVLTLDLHHLQFERSRIYNLASNPSSYLRLVNDYILCNITPCEDYLSLEFRDLSEDLVFYKLKVESNSAKSVHSVIYASGMFKFLVQSQDSTLSVLSFNHQIPTESLSFHDHYKQFPSPEGMNESCIFVVDLERLIENDGVVITSKLVEYIIDNKLESCSRKILKCQHIPEIEAVKLLSNDPSLMDDFLNHITGSDEMLKLAFRKYIDKEGFEKMVDKILEMMRESELEGDFEKKKRGIKMMNVLLDAKVMDVKQFDAEMVEKLKDLVEGCQKEHLNLQSLLSFTNTLLDNKFKYNTNPLITSVDISLE